MTLIIPILISINLLSLNKPDTSVLGMVNEIRVENGLSPVKYNRKLAKSSKAKACDMNNKHYIAHTSPDGRLWEFIKDTKLKIRFVRGTAITIWTKGGFITGDFYEQIYFLEVDKKDADALKEFFSF